MTQLLVDEVLNLVKVLSLQKKTLFTSARTGIFFFNPCFSHHNRYIDHESPLTHTNDPYKCSCCHWFSYLLNLKARTFIKTSFLNYDIFWAGLI